MTSAEHLAAAAHDSQLLTQLSHLGYCCLVAFVGYLWLWRLPCTPLRTSCCLDCSAVFLRHSPPPLRLPHREEAHALVALRIALVHHVGEAK